MNKNYPAIFYPPLILKFLAKNHVSNFQQNYNNYPQLIKLSNKKSRHSDTWITQLSYLIIFYASTISILILVLMPSYAWLIVLILTSIILGIFCFISSHPNQQKTKDYFGFLQIIPKVSNRNGMQMLPNKAILNHWLQEKVLQPSGISEAQVGVSEKYFYQVLIHIFPNVSQGAKFDNKNSPYPYSADFILVHTSGLSIDIEIDEPYVGNTKEPHHCIDQGKDKIRNQFFTSNNWLVIRFSEKQVVKYPYRCCKVISSIIARVAGDYTFLDRLQNVPNLPIEPMWNIKQAKKWAKLDYRKTYLPVYQK